MRNVVSSTPLNLSTITLEQLVSGPIPLDPLTVLEWLSSSTLPIQISRVDSKPLFKSNKTYWLVGLSGGLGLSLCDWMVEHGARYVVISSRNPKIDPVWLENHDHKGVKIKVFKK